MGEYISKIKQKLNDTMTSVQPPSIDPDSFYVDCSFDTSEPGSPDNLEDNKSLIMDKLQKMKSAYPGNESFVTDTLQRIKSAQEKASRTLDDSEADYRFDMLHDDSLSDAAKLIKAFSAAQDGHPDNEWYKKKGIDIDDDLSGITPVTKLETEQVIADTDPGTNQVIVETKPKAKKEKTDIAAIPDKMFTITDPALQNALSYNDKPSKGAEMNAYIAATTPAEGQDIDIDAFMELDVAVKDNKIYRGQWKAIATSFKDIYKMNRGSMMEIQESDRYQLQESDHHFLSAVYTILYKNIVRMVKGLTSLEPIRSYNAEVYLPDLMEYLGYGRDFNEEKKNLVMRQLASYGDKVGVIAAKGYRGYYKLLFVASIRPDDEEYEDENRKGERIRLFSPYMNELICIMCNEQIEQNLLSAKQEAMRELTNAIKNLPTHSSLIKPDIVKARNKRASELVDIVVTLIEQAGPNSTPRISAETMIDRCPALDYSLQCCEMDRDRNRLLKKTFGTAWQYLDEYTYLKETYKNIRFPTEVPKMKRGHIKGDMMFEFPHDGKF